MFGIPATPKTHPTLPLPVACSSPSPKQPYTPFRTRSTSLRNRSTARSAVAALTIMVIIVILNELRCMKHGCLSPVAFFSPFSSPNHSTAVVEGPGDVLGEEPVQVAQEGDEGNGEKDKVKDIAESARFWEAYNWKDVEAGVEQHMKWEGGGKEKEKVKLRARPKSERGKGAPEHRRAQAQVKVEGGQSEGSDVATPGVPSTGEEAHEGNVAGGNMQMQEGAMMGAMDMGQLSGGF